jgi:hypothetical protein
MEGLKDLENFSGHNQPTAASPEGHDSTVQTNMVTGIMFHGYVLIKDCYLISISSSPR